MLTVEQVLSAQKIQLETLLGLSASGLDAAEKLSALSLEIAKATLGEAGDKAKAVLSAKDVQEVFALQTEMLQPSTEKATAYGRKAYEIVAALQAEFGKVVEAGAADAQSKFTALVDSAAKNAPAGSETAVSMMKAAVSAANDAYDGMQKAAKQAAGAAEANFTTLSAVVTKPATGRAKKAA
jgi:phasin family protein